MKDNSTNCFDMIVIDDYENGIIMAGGSIHDFADDISPAMKEALLRVTEQNIEENPIAYAENGEDFYVFYMDPDYLMKYMSERNCLNYVVGL